MEFLYPPAPRGYLTVLIVRWLLVAWAVIGVGILIKRLRQWKSIRSSEMRSWCIAAVSSSLVAAVSYSHRLYDEDLWLLPALTAALSVCAGGVTIGLAKLYEGSAEAKRLVVGIIGVVALSVVFGTIVSLPTHGSHPTPRRTQCKDNLKQIALAMHNYHDLTGALFPSSSGDPPVSWRISILPFIDRRRLSDQYNEHKAWDDVVNDKVSRQRVLPLICPSNYSPRYDSRSRWFTSYSLLTGPNTVGAKPAGTSFKDIIDGNSNTLLVVEACGEEIVWTEPRDVDTSKQVAGINVIGKPSGRSEGWMSSSHTGGAHAALADGTVRFLNQYIDPKILKKLSTIDRDDELLPGEDF